MQRRRGSGFVCAIFAALVMAGLAPLAHGQGVTTGNITGVVVDSQGGVVPGVTVVALHQPSGTTYESITQADGRFFIPGMRVGGPYKVSASLTGFGTEAKDSVTVTLGGATDLSFTLNVAAVEEVVTVVAATEFSSTRTGAATSLNRDELATLPTTGGRLNDMVRLTPQSSGMSFAGQDNRLNNITVDGSYFNNSFGLRATPGDTSGVAPISLEAIEQVQVNIAPFDVRQGNFVGAGVNTVTRSGTNQLRGSFYHRIRNEDFVGTEAAGNTVNPGTFSNRNTGGWAGGPIIKNRLFAFGNYEDELETRPIHTFVANDGTQPVGGSISRVKASDLDTLSAFLASKFNYETGPYAGVPDETPAKRFLLRNDFNLNNSNKVSFRFNYLDSLTDSILSTSSSLGVGRQSGTSTNFLSFQNSNYQILENIRSGIGEWNSIFGGNKANNLIIGYTSQDESRNSRGTMFPFVDILDAPGGIAYTSFGFEPFTPNNELRYWTFQLQENFTWFTAKHSITVGGSYERYRSENVFFPGSQSAYVYNSLADFYTDANDYLANPNRTVSPVSLRRFQVRYNNIPGQEKPIQPLEVQYSGVYAQDEWRPRKNLTLSAGVRMDVPVFGDTAYPNEKVDGLTFRDETGAQVQYSTGKLPDPKMLWSPRVGFNLDVFGDQTTQLRGGTGVFTGRPAYVWISNQIGNTGVLTGFDQFENTTSRPFDANIDRYKPSNVTGAPASSVDLAVTDPEFKFPQVWRTNFALDRKLPWNTVGTLEYLYNRDVNGIYYINANLPAAQSAFTGVDTRPRWTGPSCSTPAVTGCVTRLNNAPGNQVTNAIVLKNQDIGRSWNIAATLTKNTRFGLNVKGAYSYGESKNTVDPGSIASGSWSGNHHSGDPNNPGLAFSANSPGHRLYVRATFAKQYFNFGATAVSFFWETRTAANSSYLFSGDANGDGSTNNDLIYIPRDQSEMNFVQFVSGGRTYTAAEQAAAFEAYINQDEYLSAHRGQYAGRYAVFYPRVTRADLSISQDVFGSFAGARHSGQIRLDVLNVGNLLNHDWGVSYRMVQNQVLTSPSADATGKLAYRLAVFNNALVKETFQRTSSLSDVYSFMISFRYTFN